MYRLYKKLIQRDNITAAIIGLFCGMFCIYGFCPLAMPLFIVYAQTGKYKKYICGISSLVGIFISRNFICFFPFAIGMFLYVVIKFILKNTDMGFITEMLILVSSSLSAIVFHHDTRSDCFLVLLMCLISAFLVPVLYNSLNAVNVLIRNKRMLSEKELIFLCVSCGLATLLLSPYSTDILSPAVVLCGFLILCGACVDNICGLYIVIFSSLGLAVKYNAALVSCLICAGLVCSLLRKRGKLVCLCYFAILCIVALVTQKMTVWDAALPPCVFAVLPEKFKANINMKFYIHHKEKKDEKQASHLSRAIMALSGTYPHDSFASRQFENVARLMDEAPQTSRTKLKFEIQTGMACVPKDNCACTGDSVRICECKSRIIISLSDGMGSGILAHNESSAAIATFEDMICAGFSIKDSVDCANRRLLMKGDGEFYATLDSVIFDRQNSYATFIKNGASSSYLIRSGKAIELKGEALPIGIVENVTASVRREEIEDKDIIVMLTDGACDALGKDLIATLIDSVQKTSEATKLAGLILDAACEYGAYDDISVVCAICKRMI